MAVTMVQVWVMGMCMGQWFVRMLMGVRFRAVPCRIMFVPVVFVMAAFVRVHEAFMPVNMVVALGDM